jgi:hypothetical protein
MEALRNYTQHRGVPIHALEFSGKKYEEESRNRFGFAIGIYTKTTYLRQEKKFKAEVLKELDELGGRVDLKPMVRDYVAALADVHELVRQSLKDLVSGWESDIQRAIERFRAAFPAERWDVGLTAAIVDGHTRTGEVPLFLELIEYRQGLAKNNAGLTKLGLLYASGETIEVPNPAPPAANASRHKGTTDSP